MGALSPRRGHPGLTVCLLAGLLLAAGLRAADPHPTGQAPLAPAPPAGPCDAPLTDPVRIQIGTVEVGVQAGGRLVLPVRAKGVCDLARFSFGLSGGADTIRLLRVDPAPFLAGKPEVDIEFIGLVPGAIRQTIQGSRPPGTGGVDGIGTLAKITLFGLRPGVAQLALERLQLWDSTGSLIPSVAIPVRVTVVENLTPQPGMPANRRAR